MEDYHRYTPSSKVNCSWGDFRVECCLQPRGQAAVQGGPGWPLCWDAWLCLHFPDFIWISHCWDYTFQKLHFLCFEGHHPIACVWLLWAIDFLVESSYEGSTVVSLLGGNTMKIHPFVKKEVGSEKGGRSASCQEGTQH